MIAVNIESDNYSDTRSQMHVPVEMTMPLFRLKHLSNFERTETDSLGRYSVREVLQIVFQLRDKDKSVEG